MNESWKTVRASVLNLQPTDKKMSKREGILCKLESVF